jgi:hypothetical protein
MRYVTIPQDIEVKNSLTGEPIQVPDPAGGMKNDIWSFTRAVKTATWIASQKSTADALELIDIRKKFEESLIGQTVELSDSEWRSLEAEFKRPSGQVFGPGYGLSAEAHIRAWIDAPTKKPQAVVEKVAEN